MSDLDSEDTTDKEISDDVANDTSNDTSNDSKNTDQSDDTMDSTSDEEPNDSSDDTMDSTIDKEPNDSSDDTSTPTDETSNQESNETSDGILKLTVAELAQYDGKDGRPAYIAYNGIIYDVSAIGAWGGGNHYGGNTAGMDLSGELEYASHGEEKLDKAVIVGELVK
jgi:predicted heme/steroid binding protein